MPSKYVCARCGCSVGWWYFGWKHQTGGYRAPKTCGGKPVPVLRGDNAAPKLKEKQ